VWFRRRGHNLVTNRCTRSSERGGGNLDLGTKEMLGGFSQVTSVLGQDQADLLLDKLDACRVGGRCGAVDIARQRNPDSFGHKNPAGANTIRVAKPPARPAFRFKSGPNGPSGFRVLEEITVTRRPPPDTTQLQ